MRETCLFCVSKHIAQAVVLVTECCNGYPLHIWFAIGHLAEAETESCSEFPEFSVKIRDVRLSLMGQEGRFTHEGLVSLLEEARNIASEVNGVPERERITKILYPGKDVTYDCKCIETPIFNQIERGVNK